MSKNSKWFAVVAFLLTAVIGVLLVVAPEPKDSWLPINRPELVRLVSKGMDVDSLSIQNLEGFVDAQRTEFQSNAKELDRFQQKMTVQTKLLSPNDTVSFIQGDDLPFEFAMAGSGEKIHTIKITVPLVDLQSKVINKAFSALKDLFPALYPDWSNANNWPEESLSQAWDANVLWRKKKSKEYDPLFIHKDLDGTTSTTFGVPPDYVVYNVTTKERCILSPTLGSPLRRIIC